MCLLSKVLFLGCSRGLFGRSLLRRGSRLFGFRLYDSLLGRHGCQQLCPEPFAQLRFHLGTGIGLRLLLSALLFRNQIFCTAALLLVLNPVLHILVLKQHAEELNQMEQEEQEHRDNNDNQEAGTGLQVIKYLACTADAEGVFADNLRLVNSQSVSRTVVITLGGEDQITAAVINLFDSMGVQYPLAVDDGPVGNDIARSEFTGILNTGIKDQIAGQQCGVHGFGLDREHPNAQNTGHAVAGGRNVGHIGANGRQSNGQHQNNVHNGVQYSFARTFLRGGLNIVIILGLGLSCYFLFLLHFHGEISLPVIGFI